MKKLVMLFFPLAFLVVSSYSYALVYKNQNKCNNTIKNKTMNKHNKKEISVTVPKKSYSRHSYEYNGTIKRKR